MKRGPAGAAPAEARDAASAAALHATRIEEYALIGDRETAALVNRSGSIDWMCWPKFSSPACFAAMLGTADNGYWKIAPADETTRVSRAYRGESMALDTTFETRDGTQVLTDFMPPRGRHSDVVRIVRCVRGKARLRMDLVLRFDYGRTVPWVTSSDHTLRMIAGKLSATLRWGAFAGSVPKLRGKDLTTVSEFTLTEGDEVYFVLTCSESQEPAPEAIDVRASLASTLKTWGDFAGKVKYDGAYRPQVVRSLLALEAMTDQKTGGMVAAPTMSLPEKAGGVRNWDYRYCWLRDTSLAMLVMVRAGLGEEAERWREWLTRAIAGSAEQMQIMYGLSGERQLTEWEVGWLRGYEESRPVRVGNAASEQFQLDVFGDTILAMTRAPLPKDESDRRASLALQANLVEHTCRVWDQPDDGIWEVRGPRQHFVYSKMMAWAALDRAVEHHEIHGERGIDVKRWAKNRDMLHKEICRKGFNKKLNAFTQAYGSDALDASLLQMVVTGFLPADDPRIVGTVVAIQQHLMRDGLVLRYDTTRSQDGLPEGEGAFLACSFWLVIALWLIGRQGEAVGLFERLLALANDVGLLSEQYDPVEKRMLGNFPQALSHLAMVHAAYTIAGVFKPELGVQPR